MYYIVESRVAQGSGEEIITVSLWLYCQLLGYVSVSNDLFRCNSMSYYTNEAFLHNLTKTADCKKP